jgi:hypothetical protein
VRDEEPTTGKATSLAPSLPTHAATSTGAGDHDTTDRASVLSKSDARDPEEMLGEVPRAPSYHEASGPGQAPETPGEAPTSPKGVFGRIAGSLTGKK